MNNSPVSEKLRALFPYFLLAIAVIIAYRIISELAFFMGIVGSLWGIITPFFYGFLLAYVLNIPYSSLFKLLGKSKNEFVLKRRKALSIAGVYLGLILVVYSVIRLIVPAVYDSVLIFNAELQTYLDRTIMFFDDLVGMEILGMEITYEGLASLFQDVVAGFDFSNFAGHVNTFLTGVASAVFTSILALISSIYILVEKDKLKAYAYRLIRAFSTPLTLEAIMEFSGRLNRNFKQYIYTQTIDGLILGTIVTIALYILGSPFFLILGIMLGIVNYIPYFGSIIGSIIAVLIIAITQDINTALIGAVVLFVIQQIDGNFIQPRLMSGSFSLSPLLVIVSITIGGAFAGILGMIATIPIIAVLKDLFEGLIVHHEWKKLEKGERFNHK